MFILIEIKDFNESALKNELKEFKKIKAYRFNNLSEKLYSVKTLPVRVDGIIIDYKLFQKFVKTLKGFEMKILIMKDHLKLLYWKNGANKQNELILKDLSGYFEGFRNIPDAVLVDG